MKISIRADFITFVIFNPADDFGVLLLGTTIKFMTNQISIPYKIAVNITLEERNFILL